MGWIPEPGGAGANRVRVVELVDDAATKTLYLNGPQAVYSPEANRTYVAYMGLDRDLYVTYYDHHANEVATAVKVDDRTIDVDDDHGAPTICVDLDGFIHVIWGSHNSQGRHVMTDAAHDISAWTGQTLTHNSTYNYVRVDPNTGDLYNFYRAGSGHGGSFPAHEFAGMSKSTDGGSNWSSETAIIDGTGFAESHCDIYLEGVDVDDDGLFHLVWYTARGTSHDDTRRDFYHVIFDPSDDTLHSVDGTDLGSTVDSSEHADCLVASDSQVDGGDVFVDGSRIVVWWQSVVDSVTKVGIWDTASSSAWDVNSTGLGSFGMVYPVKDGLRYWLNYDTTGDTVKDAVLFGGPEDASYWHEIALLQTGVDGFSHKSRVLNFGGPSTVLFAEQDDSNEPNNATASDLTPLYMLIDEASQEYAGQVASDHNHDSDYSATDHDHDDTYALIGSAGAGELLMQDGVTAPPVPIETEARDDWLYEDV